MIWKDHSTLCHQTDICSFYTLNFESTRWRDVINVWNSTFLDETASSEGSRIAQLLCVMYCKIKCCILYMCNLLADSLWDPNMKWSWCLIFRFSMKSVQLSLLSFTPLHLLLSHSSFLPWPSCSSVLCSCHLSDWLLMPSFLLPLSSLLPLWSCPARCHAVCPWFTATALPAPAVKPFQGGITCRVPRLG